MKTNPTPTQPTSDNAAPADPKKDRGIAKRPVGKEEKDKEDKGGGKSDKGSPPNPEPVTEATSQEVKKRKDWMWPLVALIAGIAIALAIYFKPSGEKEVVKNLGPNQEVPLMDPSSIKGNIGNIAGTQRKTAEKNSAFVPPAPVNSVKGIESFNPTENVNLPTVGRVERHSSPNGDFYLLFGANGRMITTGGETINLMEPHWAKGVVRPKGKLKMLDPVPSWLVLFPGRYPVAVVP